MKQKTADAMRPIVEAYAQYKGSKKSFCKEQGVAIHTFDYWRRKFNAPQANSSAFVALDVVGLSLGQSVELHYPNGIRAIIPMEAPARIFQNLLTITD